MEKIRTFFIELTNICNFNCLYCPIDKMKRQRGMMDLSLAKKIIDEIYDKKLSNWICLHLMGEPTLHPKFFDIIRYLNAKSLNISLVTNGNFIARNLAEGLKDKKIASLQISVNAFGPEQFEYRVAKNIKYEEYIANIKEFIKTFLSYSNSTPVLLSYFLKKNSCLTMDNKFASS